MYDVIVVGAGTAGCIASRVLAESDFNVCLIERKAGNDVGDKVCGDAVGRHHFDNLGLSYPQGNELACKVDGIEIFSPDEETVFRIGGMEGFMIDRRSFGQRLLKDSLNAGVEFLDRCKAINPIVRRGRVVGVHVEHLRERRGIRAKVTIDATGFVAALRKKMSRSGFESVDDRDVMVCYREIRELASSIGTKFCRIYLGRRLAPGGYMWIFPKGRKRVNVGLGVQVGGNPKHFFYKSVLTRSVFGGSKALKRGGGLVPTRRPLSRFVHNGFMILGDVACLVNPIHGGGIGPSMMSGKLAAEAAIDGLRRGDVSAKSLWSYPISYMKAYGAKQAGLDVFRLFLQSLSDEDLNYGMRYKLVREEDVLGASMGGEVKLRLSEKVKRLFRGLGKISLVKKLVFTAKAMKRFKGMYLRYPDFRGFDRWRALVEDFYFEVRHALGYT
jgi:geranylgeranyl reductase family protein